MFEKAPSNGAFFIPVFSLLPLISTADCRLFEQLQPAEVSHVYDGDTLGLTDGRIIRLIGVNTPEMGQDNGPDEPGAISAKRRLSAILQTSGNGIFLFPGEEREDRYRRVLAHVHDARGRNITEILLREGLGSAIYIPPNLANLECYQEAERIARQNRRGLWKKGEYVLDASRMSGHETGFHHIQGEIIKISRSRRSLWFNFRKGPALRIDWSDWMHFKHWKPEDLLGRRLEVRGWIYQRKGQQRIQVRHPAALKWIDAAG